MEVRNNKGQTEEEFLKEYNPDKYKKPSVTVDNVIIQDGDIKKLLLIKRGNFPDMGKWALPGGFIEMDEDLEESAKRELREETGIDDVFVEQLRTFGEVHRDKRDRVITVAFLAIIDEEIKVNAADDANEAAWFCIEDIKSKILKDNSKNNNRIVEKEVKFKLKANDIEISPVLIVREEIRGKMKKIQVTIKEKSILAADHSKIIYYGIKNILNI